MLPRWSAVVCALFFVAVCAGCGDGDEANDAPRVSSASGKVRKSNGDPVSGGSVSLSLQGGGGPSVNGRIETDGSFVLKTVTAGGAVVDGCPPGKYLVTIVPDFSQDQTTVPGPPPAPAQLPAPIEVTEAGPNEFELIAP